MWDFFQGMQGYFNIQNSINVIYYVTQKVTEDKKKHMIILIATEKAFGKIQHPILIF